MLLSRLLANFTRGESDKLRKAMGKKQMAVLQELKGKFTDDDLFYFIDLLADYYVESGLLEAEPDADGFVDIDTEAVAKAIAERAKKEKYGDFSAEDLLWVVQGELEFGEQE